MGVSFISLLLMCQEYLLKYPVLVTIVLPKTVNYKNKFHHTSVCTACVVCVCISFGLTGLEQDLCRGFLSPLNGHDWLNDQFSTVVLWNRRFHIP